MASGSFDYGLGQTNIDRSTGIRFGVIPQNDILQAWADSSEADYGPATCGECGNEAVSIDEVPFDLDDCKVVGQVGYFRKRNARSIPRKHRAACGGHEEWRDEGREYACLSCARSFDSDDAFGDEPTGYVLDDGEYKAESGSDGDVFVTLSPYFTYGPLCSPCAPGAVYLRDGDEEGAKAYCFAPDWFNWFTDDGKEAAGEYDGEKTSCPYPVFRVSDGARVYTPAKVE